MPSGKMTPCGVQISISDVSSTVHLLDKAKPRAQVIDLQIILGGLTRECCIVGDRPKYKETILSQK